MTNTQIAWLAGLLEGEGCFQFTKNNSPKFTIRMTDEDVIRRVGRMLSVTVLLEQKYKSHLGIKPTWCVHVYGEPALKIMRLVLPYTGERRSEKIQSVINSRRNRFSRVLSESTSLNKKRAERCRVLGKGRIGIPLSVQHKARISLGVFKHWNS